MVLRLILALLLLLAGPGLAPLHAQDRASLIADSLAIRGDDTLVAEGAVEVFYRGARLKATRITYDRAADRLRIEGPIVLQDGTGTLVLADQADLSADMADGILTSARLVLNEQLQMAAAEMMRAGGRYTQLTRAVASACEVCAEDPVPLWEIRARRIVHDQLERQIYFDHPQFRVAGLPVFYIPRLRMPDPTLKRATGFLLPRLRTTSGLGTGLKFPYFITLGPHRDLTLTPYLTTRGGRTVEFRFRQAFATGTVQLDGALSQDNLLPGEWRGYLLGTGRFSLPRGFALTFRAEAVSDPAYLLDYGISEADRLDSRIEVTRTRRDEYISARLIGFQSLREGDVASTLPALIADATWRRRFGMGPLGGQGGVLLQFHSHARPSTDPDDGADPDSLPDGRDAGRLTLAADWGRDLVLANGMVATVLAEASADAFRVAQDAAFAGSTFRTQGALAAELRWPWLKAGAGGVTHVIEPVVQLALSGGDGDALRNEDSALVEFDEGNLFSLNRFPGRDAVERGARLNIGLGYTRIDPAGWSLRLAMGRVLRQSDDGQFTAASGLDGTASDWLAVWALDIHGGLSLTNRLVFDDGLDLTKAELRLGYARDRFALSSSYLHVAADAAEDRPQRTEELALDASYGMTANWTANLSSRYDFVAGRATRAGLGLSFRNECAAIDLSLSRRFTSSTSVKPTTDFGLSVELLGFGSGTAAGPARTCRR